MSHIIHTFLLALRLVGAADFNTKATTEWLVAHNLLRESKFESKKPQALEVYLDDENKSVKFI